MNDSDYPNLECGFLMEMSDDHINNYIVVVKFNEMYKDNPRTLRSYPNLFETYTLLKVCLNNGRQVHKINGNFDIMWWVHRTNMKVVCTNVERWKQMLRQPDNHKVIKTNMQVLTETTCQMIRLPYELT
jgi:hypothetical protein